MFLRLCGGWLAGLLILGAAQAADKKLGVNLIESPDKIRVEIDGELFTEYVITGAPHVYFYPVIGPRGTAMTRHWPMKEVAGEERDHPHHRSLWYSHGAVNGVDFWSEATNAGRIVHDKFLEVRSGADVGVIRSRNKWIAPNGEVPLTDETVFRVHRRPASERVFDFEITLRAGDKEVVLGDTKEGSMAIRIHEAMRLSHGKGKPGTGRIVQSTGVRDGDTWGKRAAWCDYYGPVDGATLGIAMFDHPGNPRHPTHWHVRDYGLFAANPFGVHDFEKQPKDAGDMKIPAQGSVRFRYRFYVHEGDTEQAKVAERYRAYAAE